MPTTYITIIRFAGALWIIGLIARTLIAEGWEVLVEPSITQFGLVGGGHQHHAGQAAEIGDVVSAGVRGAVGADQSGPVDRHEHGKVLQRHVMDQLVIGALQER